MQTQSRSHQSETHPQPRSISGPLPPPQVAGALSLLPGKFLAVAAVPGMVARVVAGSLTVVQEHDRQQQQLPAGASYLADRESMVGLYSGRGARLQVSWPATASVPAGTDAGPAASSARKAPSH